MAENLDLLMLLGLCLVILTGFPVTFLIAGLGVLFAGLGWAMGVFDLSLLRALAQRIFGIMTNQVLIAIPLFVLMGTILERSRIAEDLLEQMGRLFGTLRGGLAVSVVVVGALLAASTGIVGATVVTMGLIALPAMLRNGYGRGFAAGSVVTAGTLGQIIPPSTMLIILSDVMSTSYQQAQYAQGLFSVQTISVGQVFAAAILPGLVLVALYIAYILFTAWRRPDLAPPMPATAEKPPWTTVLATLLPPIVLIVAVLGSILGGIATPTEAASVGAIGALLLAGLRLAPGRRGWPVWLAIAAIVALLALTAFVDLRLGRTAATAAERHAITIAFGLVALLVIGLAVCLVRAHKAGILAPVLTQTMTISAMIFGTIIGASIFSLVLRGLGGDHRIEGLVEALPGGTGAALLAVMAAIFVLGFFLDFVEISIIILPLTVPLLLLMGLDPIWLAVLIAINLQTSFLTPPFGFSLFYLRGAAPPEIKTLDIYKGVVPFIGLQILAIVMIWLFPAIATTLPALLF
jgi:TRAP-type mannitol/chloroaromatic compound transport system permease large subunit